MKYVLMGMIRFGYGSPDVHSRVATFDSEKMAYAYIKKATLSKPSKMNHKIFKRASVLSSYDDAWVEEEDDDIPHNPAL